jgi:protein-L-isoaspartate(D-aspartate) O-methyltransferase
MESDVRDRMVDEQLVARGIRDSRVLSAMRTVPRHLFVPRVHPERAYEDHPLPIGHGQTISQPFIVAFMTEALGVEPGARVLEVGTGSGYQAAVLAAMGAEVFSIEIVPALGAHARRALAAAGIRADGPAGAPGVVHLSIGDGSLGWPDAAPFDRIMATAAPQQIPLALVEQLGPEGRLIAPVGSSHSQDLRVVERHGDAIETRHILPVLFVPMTGAVPSK